MIVCTACEFHSRVQANTNPHSLFRGKVEFGFLQEIHLFIFKEVGKYEERQSTAAPRKVKPDKLLIETNLSCDDFLFRKSL